MQPPPSDDKGVLPHDHPGIVADDLVIRRISEQFIVNDPRSGGRRISSMAYRESSTGHGGMSVDLERLILEAGIDPRVFATTPRWIGSVYFEAGQIRSLGCRIGYDPSPDNPYHGEVWLGASKASRSLQLAAVWSVPIPEVSP